MRYCVALILFLAPLSAHVEEWRLDELVLDQLEVVKCLPMQTLYRSKDFFLKIWEEGQRNMINGRNTFFVQAVRGGHLEGIAPLIAIVINDRGECCGYATWVCRPIKVDFIKLRRGGFDTPSLSVDEYRLLQLFSKMQITTQSFGVLFNDLSPTNMGISNGKCYFYDLDGIWDREQYMLKYSQEPFYLSEKFLDKN